MNKLGYNFVKQKLKENGYILLESEYISNDSNMKIKTKDGYYIYNSYSNLISSKRSPIIFGFTNPYWEHNVKVFISKMRGNSKILDIKQITKSNKKRILVKGKCSCGEEFNWVFSNDLNKTDKFMCQRCKKKITSSKRRIKFNEAKEIFDKYGYKIISDKKDFNKMNDKILVEDKNGYRGYMTIRHVKRGQHFSVFSNSLNEDFIIYNANICMKNMGSNTIVESIDSTKYYKGAFNCVCGCGNKFSAPIYSLVGGTKIMCSTCSNSMSSYERIIKSFLDKNNILYKQEYTIHNCRDVLPLPFDFYINGKLIEIDGEGHYYPCNFNQISEEDALKTFNITKKHDEIKNKYCKDNNIQLLRIPYYHFIEDKYKEEIISFIRD